MSKRAGTRTKMERLISRWEKSGRSCRAFAEANGVSVAKFYYWKRRLERKAVESRRRKSAASGSRFLPVQLVGNTTALTEPGGLVELVLETGERVRLTEGVSEEMLRRVIRILREREC